MKCPFRNRTGHGYVVDKSNHQLAPFIILSSSFPSLPLSFSLALALALALFLLYHLSSPPPETPSALVILAVFRNHIQKHDSKCLVSF